MKVGGWGWRLEMQRGLGAVKNTGREEVRNGWRCIENESLKRRNDLIPMLLRVVLKYIPLSVIVLVRLSAECLDI